MKNFYYCHIWLKPIDSEISKLNFRVQSISLVVVDSINMSVFPSNVFKNIYCKIETRPVYNLFAVSIIYPARSVWTNINGVQ